MEILFHDLSVFNFLFKISSKQSVRVIQGFICICWIILSTICFCLNELGLQLLQYVHFSIRSTRGSQMKPRFCSQIMRNRKTLFSFLTTCLRDSVLALNERINHITEGSGVIIVQLSGFSLNSGLWSVEEEKKRSQWADWTGQWSRNKVYSGTG